MIAVHVQIKYAGSEAHVTELLEKVCDNANDYATSTDDNGKWLTIVVYNLCRFKDLLVLVFADMHILYSAFLTGEILMNVVLVEQYSNPSKFSLSIAYYRWPKMPIVSPSNFSEVNPSNCATIFANQFYC